MSYYAVYYRSRLPQWLNRTTWKVWCLMKPARLCRESRFLLKEPKGVGPQM